MSKMKTNTYLVDTTFIAYFDVDEIGIEVPNEADGAPDKYQIKFNMYRKTQTAEQYQEG